MRLFFWFFGVPRNIRPGGPWWYRDFSTRKEAEDFLADVKGVCHAYCLTSSAFEIENDNIRPPKGEPVIYPNGEENV